MRRPWVYLLIFFVLLFYTVANAKHEPIKEPTIVTCKVLTIDKEAGEVVMYCDNGIGRLKIRLQRFIKKQLAGLTNIN